MVFKSNSGFSRIYIKEDTPGNEFLYATVKRNGSNVEVKLAEE